MTLPAWETLAIIGACAFVGVLAMLVGVLAVFSASRVFFARAQKIDFYLVLAAPQMLDREFARFAERIAELELVLVRIAGAVTRIGSATEGFRAVARDLLCCADSIKGKLSGEGGT
ncbi:MAG TPA: hypothetical protein VGZ00_11710 [Candidatus Baltobacteraceae bacterium]|nr:hypothetical protein [Candidatus Baltobacteraceae bacterium]